VPPDDGGAVPVDPGTSPSPGAGTSPAGASPAGASPAAAAPAATLPRDPAADPLAFTGADALLLVAGGLGLLLLGTGAALLVLRRRRLG
jgi:hypothetical protein